MTVLFSPFGNSQFVDNNGVPAQGYTITTYAAGSSALLATYTDSSGASANANPVTLNAAGRNPNGQFWLTSGLSYKFVLKDASGTVVQTVDGITGTNDAGASTTVDQWVSYSGAPTYISATSFSVSGDQTSTLHAGRRIKTTNTAGTRYSTVTASSFGAGITTVTVANDSGTLDSGLSQVSYALLSAINNSLPRYPAFSAFLSASQSLANSTFVKLGISAEDFDTTGAYDNITNYRFQPAVAGYYQISGGARLGGTGLSDVALAVYKNGAIHKRLGGLTVASTAVQVSGSALVYLNGTDYVELFAFTTATSGNLATGGPEYSFFQAAFVRAA